MRICLKYFKLKKFFNILLYHGISKKKTSYLKSFIRHPKSGPPRFTSIMQKGGQIFQYIIFSCCHSTTHNTFSLLQQNAILGLENTLQLENVWHHTHNTWMWPLVLYQRPHCQFTTRSSCCTLCLEACIYLQILSIYLYTHSKGQSRREALGTRLLLN